MDESTRKIIEARKTSHYYTTKRGDLMLYFISVRLPHDDNEQNLVTKFHISAYSASGAIAKVMRLCLDAGITTVTSIKVDHRSYPYAKKKRRKYLKSLKRNERHHYNTLKDRDIDDAMHEIYMKQETQNNLKHHKKVENPTT